MADDVSSVWTVHVRISGCTHLYCFECQWLDRGNDRCMLFATEHDEEGRPIVGLRLRCDPDGQHLRAEQCRRCSKEE